MLWLLAMVCVEEAMKRIPFAMCGARCGKERRGGLFEDATKEVREGLESTSGSDIHG